MFSFSYSCHADRQKSIDKKKEICLNQAMIAYQAVNQSTITGTLTLQYTCSATSGYSPSCYEYYATNKKDDFCPIGYSKSTAKCSNQNLIGICRYVPLNTIGQSVTVVFTKPSDTLDQGRSFCYSADINGSFTESYLAPNASVTSVDQTILNFFVCENKAEKN